MEPAFYSLRRGLPGAPHEIHVRYGHRTHTECVDTFDNRGAALSRLRALERAADYRATWTTEPEALAEFRRTANLSAFCVAPGFVRRIANGGAVSYVYRDGSRFVVLDSGAHVVRDETGHEWARRRSGAVARGTFHGYYGVTRHGQD